MLTKPYTFSDVVTLEDAQRVINYQPELGSVFSRDIFPNQQLSGKHKREGGIEISWHLVTNYRVLEKYHPKQQMEHLGMLLTVWGPIQHFQCESRVLETRTDNVLEAIEALYQKALANCVHPQAKHLNRGNGNCLTAYHCPDCDSDFQIDSSG